MAANFEAGFSKTQHSVHLGPFTINRSRKQHYYLFTVTVFSNSKVIGKQFSMPSMEDCLRMARIAVREANLSAADLVNIQRLAKNG